MTTGAAAVRNNDQLLIAGEASAGPSGRAGRAAPGAAQVRRRPAARSSAGGDGGQPRKRPQGQQYVRLLMSDASVI